MYVLFFAFPLYLQKNVFFTNQTGLLCSAPFLCPSHPLTTHNGLSRTHLREIPAAWHASTTALTSL